MRKILNPYVSEITDMLDKYITEKEIGDEIYTPLNHLVNEISILDTNSFNNLNNTFFKGIRNKNSSNFFIFHCIRNLKLTAHKIVDSFKLAKARMLNPLVAKQLKQFIDPFIKFLVILNFAQEGEIIQIDYLSEELEKFRVAANEASFLCTTDEELKYDKISHKEFRKIIESMRNISNEEIIDL